MTYKPLCAILPVVAGQFRGHLAVASCTPPNAPVTERGSTATQVGASNAIYGSALSRQIWGISSGIAASIARLIAPLPRRWRRRQHISCSRLKIADPQPHSLSSLSRIAAWRHSCPAQSRIPYRLEYLWKEVVRAEEHHVSLRIVHRRRGIVLLPSHGLPTSRGRSATHLASAVWSPP